MKWRPISELSDEQRDGRWWLFLYSDFSGIEERRFNKEAPDNWETMSDWSYLPDYGYFLSEPLPDFPKPQKMEWRKFEDEMPEDGSEIIIWSKHLGLIHYHSCNKNYPYEVGSSWMPIIPPEDE
jgi:hypothetical protein